MTPTRSRRRSRPAARTRIRSSRVSIPPPRARTRRDSPPPSPTSASNSSPSSLTVDGAVAAQWVMRGTNSGPFNGLPPTGREIALPGADFITFADDGSGIASVTGYFDSARVPRDLGLDVIVQPTTIGPWTFGVASRASAGRAAPAGAISLTFLEARSDEEVQEVRTRYARDRARVAGGARVPLVPRRDRRAADVHHQRVGDARGGARHPRQRGSSRGRRTDVRTADRFGRADRDLGAVATQRAHRAVYAVRHDGSRDRGLRLRRDASRSGGLLRPRRGFGWPSPMIL